MLDLSTPLPFAAASIAALALVSAAGLRAWRQWLELKRSELARNGPTAARSDLGDLKRRIRRLEALASGIDV